MKERSYSKVKRGMVFYYNIDPSVDKKNVPPINVLGRQRYDNREYGWRPFVVISSDEVCQLNRTVCITPMRSTSDKDIQQLENRVYFNYGSELAEVLCEHIYTVNTSELTRYDSFLNECVMSEIDKKIAMNLSIPYERVFRDRASLKDIENIILAIVQKRVDEVRKEQVTAAKASGVDIDDAVLRIGDELSNLFDVKLEELKNQISSEPDRNTVRIDEKNYSKPELPRYKPSSKEFPELLSGTPGNKREELIKNLRERKKSKYKNIGRDLDEVYQRKSVPNIESIRKHDRSTPWTENEIIEFLHDWDEYDWKTLMKKYRCDEKKQLHQLRARLLRKLGV